MASTHSPDPDDDDAERLVALEGLAGRLADDGPGDEAAGFMAAARKAVDAWMAAGKWTVAAAALVRLGALPAMAARPRLRAVLAMMGLQVRLVAGRAADMAEPVAETRRLIAEVAATAPPLAASLEADLEQAVAAAHEACGANALACRALDRAVALRAGLVGSPGLPDQRPPLCFARNALARLLLREQRPGEAIDVLEDCLHTLAVLANDEGGLPPRLFNLRCAANNRLGRALAAEGREAEALTAFRDAVGAMRQLVEAPGGDPYLHDFLHALEDLEAAERQAGNIAVADDLRREGGRRHAHHHH